MSQTNALDQLKQFTTVVADTGDFESIRAYEPQDATTNPTLIFKAVQQAEYKPLLAKAISDNRGSSLSGSALHRKVIDDLLIAFGREILSIVPGRVSTEVDARLSFDIEATVEKARYLIGLYEKLGTPRERVLIKIASTWEGAQAAAICQKPASPAWSLRPWSTSPSTSPETRPPPTSSPPSGSTPSPPVPGSPSPSAIPSAGTSSAATPSRSSSSPRRSPSPP